MASSSDTNGRLRAGTPVDLVAAVPYLIGFHPYQSVVLLGLAGARVVFTARADLPPPDDPDGCRRTADHLAEIAGRQAIEAVVLVGYGSPRHVDPLITVLAATLEDGSGIGLRDAYRVHQGRLWTYFCDAPGCCPPEGVAFDSASSPVAAAATVAGLVALPDRETYRQQVEPDPAATGDSMACATERAEARLRQAFESDDASAARRLLARRGERLLDAAVTRYAEGERLDDDEAAWLSVLLLLTDVAALAWDRMVEQPVERYLPVWRDLVRRVQPDLAAPVAAMLAYAAWRTGDGGLAGMAVRRALRESPDYQPALVIETLLLSGVGPADLAATLPARRSDPGGEAERIRAAAGGVPRSRRGRGRRR